MEAGISWYKTCWKSVHHTLIELETSNSNAIMADALCSKRVMEQSLCSACPSYLLLVRHVCFCGLFQSETCQGI